MFWVTAHNTLATYPPKFPVIYERSYVSERFKEIDYNNYADIKSEGSY